MSISRQTNVKIENFVGVDNVNDPASAANGAFQTLSDVVITDNKCIKQRTGYDTRIVNAVVHSVWSDDTICLYCVGSTLYRLHGDLTTITTIRSGLVGTGSMAYLSLNNKIYYSNGVDTGIIENGTNRTWGIVIPVQPSLTSTVGNLLTGVYQVMLTYTRDDGQESGTSDLSYIDLTSGGGITVSVTASSDTTIDYINVYATSTNGEVFWYIGTTTNTTGTFSVNDTTQFSNIPLKTQWLSEPPAGTIINFYNGRVYIVAGSIVWYTEPMAYELVNTADNYLMFPSPVTMVNPVQDGIWFATQDETFFLTGDDVPFKKTQKDDAGVIPGTSLRIDGVELGPEKTYSGPAILWPSVKHGFCAGLNGGQLLYLTKNNFIIPDEYTSGSSMVMEDSDGIYYIVALI